MKKYHLLTLLFSCLCLLTWADRVDQRVAQEIAQTVAKSYRHGSLRTSTQPPKLVYAAAAGAEGTALRSGIAPDQADYYVFNIGTEDGFVIVAGEDRVLPVLGYAEKGTFDPDHLPENLRGMLAYYQQEIDLAVRRNLTATEAVQAAWSRLTSGLGLRTGSSSETVLLETAQWGQSKPYNNQTPTISGKHALTGCVATSLGILLQYCQYPSQLTDGIDSYAGIPISYSTYDWSKMPKTCPTTTDEIEQVSSLLWHIGANVDMDYGLGGQLRV